MKSQIKRAVIVRPQLEKHPGIQIQRPQPRLRRQILFPVPFTAARKRKCAIHQQRPQLQRRLKRQILKPRLPRPIPILQRRFQIPFLKINRSQKIVGILVLGIHRQRQAQISLGLGKLFLPVRNPRQLDQKARVARRLFSPRHKRGLRLFPPLQMRQRKPAVQQKVSGLFRRLRNRAHHSVPISRFVRFFYFGKFRRGRITGLRQRAHRE